MSLNNTEFDHQLPSTSGDVPGLGAFAKLLDDNDFEGVGRALGPRRSANTLAALIHTSKYDEDVQIQLMEEIVRLTEANAIPAGRYAQLMFGVIGEARIGTRRVRPELFEITARALAQYDDDPDGAANQYEPPMEVVMQLISEIETTTRLNPQIWSDLSTAYEKRSANMSRRSREYTLFYTLRNRGALSTVSDDERLIGWRRWLVRDIAADIDNRIMFIIRHYLTTRDDTCIYIDISVLIDDLCISHLHQLIDTLVYTWHVTDLNKPIATVLPRAIAHIAAVADYPLERIVSRLTQSAAPALPHADHFYQLLLGILRVDDFPISADVVAQLLQLDVQRSGNVLPTVLDRVFGDLPLDMFAPALLARHDLDAVLDRLSDAFVDRLRAASMEYLDAAWWSRSFRYQNIVNLQQCAFNIETFLDSLPIRTNTIRGAIMIDLALIEPEFGLDQIARFIHDPTNCVLLRPPNKLSVIREHIRYQWSMEIVTLLHTNQISGSDILQHFQHGDLNSYMHKLLNDWNLILPPLSDSSKNDFYLTTIWSLLTLVDLNANLNTFNSLCSWSSLRISTLIAEWASGKSLRHEPIDTVIWQLLSLATPIDDRRAQNIFILAAESVWFCIGRYKSIRDVTIRRMLEVVLDHPMMLIVNIDRTLQKVMRLRSVQMILHESIAIALFKVPSIRDSLETSIPEIVQLVIDLMPMEPKVSTYLALDEPVANRVFDKYLSCYEFGMQVIHNRQMDLDEDCHSEDEPCCSICLNRLDLGLIESLRPCNHRFHRWCIKPWTEHSSHCPYCRSDITRSD